MSGVAKVFISTFFGWMRSLLNRIWGFVDSADSASAFHFFFENWIWIVLFLLGFGLLVDFFLYLIQRRNKP